MTKYGDVIQAEALDPCEIKASEALKGQIRQVGRAVEEIRLNLANALASLRGSPPVDDCKAATVGIDAVAILRELIFDSTTCSSMASELRDLIGD